MNNNMRWHAAAKLYLTRLCAAEYEADRVAHIKRRHSASTFRYCPSMYVDQLIECLNKNDEEEFKALKHLEGYASAIGV